MLLLWALAGLRGFLLAQRRSTDLCSQSDSPVAPHLPWEWKLCPLQRETAVLAAGTVRVCLGHLLPAHGLISA